MYLSLEKGEFKQEVFDELSDRMKETISSSPEFAALSGKPAAKQPAKAAAVAEAETADCPF